MEDQGRRVESPEKEPEVRQKGADGRTRRWTVMIMGRIGKVRSFKISPRLLFWSFLFLALYFTFSILVIHRWISLEKETRQHQTRMVELDSKLKETEKDLFRCRQDVAVLGNYIDSLEEGKDGAVAPKEAPDVGEEKTEEPPPEEATAEDLEPVVPLAGIADVEDFEITREPGKVTVNFNLKNESQGEEPLSGYIHIIATGKFNGGSWWKIYPRGEMENDFPINYRAGQPFIIQRFKPVQGSFEYTPEQGAPDLIRVVAYDNNGNLIYDSSFEVDHES